jgi:ATP-dependent Clp protease protease subunit
MQEKPLPEGNFIKKSLPLAKNRTKERFYTIHTPIVVRLYGEVNNGSIAPVTDVIKAAQLGQAPVLLLLDSPGGSVFAGLKLVSQIRTSKVPVVTLVTGMAASMAAIIHQAGHLRLMTKNSMLMFHPVAGGTQGILHEMVSLIEAIKGVERDMDELVSRQTGIPLSILKPLIIENLYLNDREAYTHNFSDGFAVNMSIDISTSEAKTKEENYITEQWR